MTSESNIEWTDSTFNPWTGCTKVGPGCDHCYAETLMDTRFGKVKWGAGQPRVRTSEANWRDPLKWNARSFYECGECGWRGDKPAVPAGEFGACPACASPDLRDTRRRVFCASLADVFDNEVATSWRVDLFDLIRLTPNLCWLLLTKRVGNVMTSLKAAHVAAYALGKMELAAWLKTWLDGTPPDHVYLGITVVNQPEADRDIVKLLAVPAAVRFLSIEPMLGCVDLCETFGMWWNQTMQCFEGVDSVPINANRVSRAATFDGTKIMRERGIDWVIAGSESGHGARRDPAMLDWLRSLRDQCSAAGVAFLWKQDADDRGRKIPTPELDGRKWVEFPT